MAQWNLIENGDRGLLIFNDSLIQETSGSPRWATVRIAAETDEIRSKFRSKPLWNVNLSGLLMTPLQYEELLAFQWNVEGMLNPFLVRNSRNYLFQSYSGVPAFLGMTDEGRTEFQLRKPRHLQGRTDKWEEIYFPNWDYPQQVDMNGNPWMVMPEMEIWVGGMGNGIVKGIQIPNNDLEVDRNNGIVVIPEQDEGLRVEVYGGFFTLMACNEDEIPVTPKGSMFVVDRGASFSEWTGE